MLQGKPIRNVFCGKDKYLKSGSHSIQAATAPILENDSYFLRVESGHGTIRINGVSFPMAPGNLFWIYCYYVVEITPERGETLRLWSYLYDYQLANYLMFPSSTHKETDRSMHLMPMVSPENPRYEEMADMISRLKAYDPQSGPGASLMKASLVGQLAELFKEAAVLDEDSDPFPLSWKLCSEIAATSTRRQTITEVARKFDISPETLNYQLRTTIGMTYDQYLSRLRSICAASYLLYEDLPLEYIWEAAGFRSEASFYRNFRKTIGMTPTEYRETVTRESPEYRGYIPGNIIVSIVNYLYEHFSENISLQTMEQELFLSGSVIRKTLSDTFGTGYKELLAVLRVCYAESLLASTDLPLIDIAVAAGFNSYSTFQRNFRKIHHISPGEYRERCHLKDGDAP